MQCSSRASRALYLASASSTGPVGTLSQQGLIHASTRWSTNVGQISAGQSLVRHYSSPSLDSHKQAVAQISTNVKAYYDRKEKFRIFHGSTNSTRPRPTGNVVDLSALKHVLKVDKAAKTALVEPNVPMDRLVEATLEHGLMPLVSMEFPGITTGGGYAGTSGESSSYKHGFFNRTINRVEMVLANGEVVTCSDKENSDLFHGAAGAVGSLGTTTLVELQLQTARKFVHTIYHPVSSMAEAIEKTKAFTADSRLDYVDGIMYSLTQGAIVTGQLTDSPDANAPIQHFSDARDPWYYLHVRDKISTSSSPTCETIPLAEYLFRYDRGGFWVGEMAFSYFKFPFNRFTRRWLDDFLHTRMMYTALHAGGQSRRLIIQDLALPYSTAEEFVQYTDRALGIYPLWLCPLKQSPTPTFHPHRVRPAQTQTQELEPMLNIGLWGWGPSSQTEFVAANKALEATLRRLGGMKWLYAQTFYDEAEFWDIYGGRAWYDALRAKYHATGLPSVYDKVRTDEAAVAERQRAQWWLDYWPVGGIVGLWKSIQSRAYVDARKSAWKAGRR